MARKSLAELLRGETRFGRLTVTGEAAAGTTSAGHAVRYAECRCDCGAERRIRVASVRSGVTVSCGCAKADGAKSLAERTCLKHGDTRVGQRAPEYGVYRAMLSRCFNPNVERYPSYGGRGITVCDAWLGDGGYEAFIADLGPRPFRGASLERRDNDGDYAPGNVRWASSVEQARNKSNTQRVSYEGQEVAVLALAERLGIPGGTLKWRIARKWPEARWAEPLRAQKPRQAAGE